MELDRESVPHDALSEARASSSGLGVRRGWVAIVVAVLGLLALLGWGAVSSVRSAFGHDNPEVLRAVQRDPMAAYVPPHVIGKPSILTRDAGEAMGMPNYAEFGRTWRLRRVDARATFAQVMRDAKRRGWHFDAVSYQPRYLRYGVPDKTSVSRMVYGDNGMRTRLPMRITLYLFDDPNSGDKMGPPNPAYAAIDVSLTSQYTDLS